MRGPRHRTLKEREPTMCNHQLGHMDGEVQNCIAKHHAGRQAAIRPRHSTHVVRQASLHARG
eukprot:1186142-Prymnesium_polylepis.1